MKAKHKENLEVKVAVCPVEDRVVRIDKCEALQDGEPCASYGQCETITVSEADAKRLYDESIDKCPACLVADYESYIACSRRHKMD